MLESVLFQILIGVYRSSYYWLIASGLTLIFGVTRVVNFAHAAFFVLGGYLAFTFFNLTGNFWFSLAAATLTTGLIGIVVERLLLKPLYRVEVLYQLLMTFAISLIINDMSKIVWGLTAQSIPIPSWFKVQIPIFNRFFPAYYVFVIGSSFLTFILLYILINRTMWGLRIRATWRDLGMAECLKINTQRIYALTFLLGTALAGLGGALMIPVSPVGPGLGDHLIITAFIVVVIAGLGNLLGTYISAYIVGIAESVFILFVPEVDILLIYAIMALILMVRPWGLFGEK
ncbi:MAG: branched-chain amino acid ABC transporter permease [Candidatus Methanomethylicia archaeon]